MTTTKTEVHSLGTLIEASIFVELQDAHKLQCTREGSGQKNAAVPFKGLCCSLPIPANTTTAFRTAGQSDQLTLLNSLLVYADSLLRVLLNLVSMSLSTSSKPLIACVYACITGTGSKGDLLEMFWHLL